MVGVMNADYKTRYEMLKLIVHTSEDDDSLHENLITAFDKWNGDDDNVIKAMRDEWDYLYLKMKAKFYRTFKQQLNDKGSE